MRHFTLLHRVSSLACAALAGALFQPGLASAVALGNIALQSSLGQPLRVVIPVALNDGETLNAACLKLVRDPTSGTPQLLTGRVNVERNAANTRLIVTSPRAVNEPALRLSVQAGCGDTTRRDYVLLLDPQETPSSVMEASAEVDESRSDAGAPRTPAAAPRAQRVAAKPAAAPASARASTTFAPSVSPAPVAGARTPSQSASPPAALAALAPREPVVLTAVTPQSGFIPEASAASLPRVSAEVLNPVTPSRPITLLPRGADVPEATLWTQTWPYAAMLLSIVAVALTAFAKRRRIVVPAWGAPTVGNLSKSSMANTDIANTFAHFGVMSEQPPIAPRAMAYPTEMGDSSHDASLDTLLGDAPLDADAIEEDVLRTAWATAVTETGADMGGDDSILKAIAAAERDLRINLPQPAPAAVDQAVEDFPLPTFKLRH